MKTLRRAMFLGLFVLTALTAFAVRAGGQVAPVSALALLPLAGAHAPSTIASTFVPGSRSSVVFAPVPFAVGEELVQGVLDLGAILLGRGMPRWARSRSSPA